LAIGSVSALQPGSISTPDHGVFKAGLINLVKRASNELAPRGISVNLISPGLIDDDRPTDFTTEVARRLDIPERTAALAEYVKRIPFGRPARSKEVARFATFMVSPLSRYVTGQNIIMDGGYTKGLLL